MDRRRRLPLAHCLLQHVPLAEFRSCKRTSDEVAAELLYLLGWQVTNPRELVQERLGENLQRHMSDEVAKSSGGSESASTGGRGSVLTNQQQVNAVPTTDPDVTGLSQVGNALWITLKITPLYFPNLCAHGSILN